MTTVIRRFAIDLRVRVGYGTAFFLLLASYLLTLYANSELLKQARLVDHSHRIMTKVETMLSALKDAETSFRGYLIMKDTLFLRPYLQSKHAADSAYHDLLNETFVDPNEYTDLATLRRLIDKKYQIMNEGLSEFNRQSYTLSDSLRVKGFFGEEIMNHIRSEVWIMQAAEGQRLKRRLEEMTTRYQTLNNIILISLGLAVIMALLGYYAYSHENKARREADDRVAEYQRQLQERIRELDEANKELIQMRSIEKFAATGRIARTIAHEVRNPLTNINLAVEQLETDLDGDLPENSTGMLEMITRNSARINSLITDLLNSTKFTELVYKKISVNQLLDETLELAKDRIQLNNITVIKNYSDKICDIAVDVERIRIAFLNLIVNAIEAMEPGKGILRLNTESTKDNKCKITITDNGPGIDEEFQSRVFEPYFTNKPKGTGLGLTNTQNIILNHNGHISLDSRKGVGTAFMILLDFA